MYISLEHNGRKGCERTIELFVILVHDPSLIAQNPMFEKENFLQTDTLLAQIAYYASLAAAKMEDYPSVLKYAPYAEKGYYLWTIRLLLIG
ncbi:hypothetical protein PZH42_30915, partial [Bacteroides cellulosilyticus]|nr:hypothetical protein [Bacteroides cellulosilyticus]